MLHEFTFTRNVKQPHRMRLKCWLPGTERKRKWEVSDQKAKSLNHEDK